MKKSQGHVLNSLDSKRGHSKGSKIQDLRDLPNKIEKSRNADKIGSLFNSMNEHREKHD